MDLPLLMETNIYGKVHADAPECLRKNRERVYNSNLLKLIAINCPCNQFHACGSSFHCVIKTHIQIVSDLNSSISQFSLPASRQPNKFSTLYHGHKYNQVSTISDKRQVYNSSCTAKPPQKR